MIKTVKIYNDDIGEVSLIDYMGDDKRAAHAARVSFLKDDIDTDKEFTDKDKRLINFLLREKHTSPFEHSTITFRLTVPAFIRSQIHRHRTFSYNEASRRYTSDNLSFYSPDPNSRGHLRQPTRKASHHWQERVVIATFSD